jgi:hypothetical protein
VLQVGDGSWLFEAGLRWVIFKDTLSNESIFPPALENCVNARPQLIQTKTVDPESLSGRRWIPPNLRQWDGVCIVAFCSLLCKTIS